MCDKGDFLSLSLAKYQFHDISCVQYADIALNSLALVETMLSENSINSLAERRIYVSVN